MRNARYQLRAWGLALRPGTMLRLSCVCLVAELLIAASTLAPGAPVVPQWPMFVLFPLVFVVHFSSVLRLAPEQRGRRLSLSGLRWDVVRQLPPILVGGFIILFAGAWLVMMVSIGSVGGQPTMSGGRYHLNNHGTFIPVTKAAYEHALVLQQRIFTLLPSVFFAFGVLAHHARRGAAAALPAQA
jgi:hypothetical protein